MDKVAQQLLDKSSQFLTQAAHVLGQTVSHVYMVLVKQQVIEGIGNLVGLGIFLLLSVYPSMWIMKKGWEWHKKDEYSEAAILLTIFGPVIITILSIVFACVVVSSIESILNPEYFAIKFIFDSVTNQ